MTIVQTLAVTGNFISDFDILGMKWPKCVVDHSLLSTAKLTNAWCYTSLLYASSAHFYLLQILIWIWKL